MGDVDIDKWIYRMEEHHRKGHKVIEYQAKPVVWKGQKQLFEYGKEKAKT